MTEASPVVFVSPLSRLAASVAAPTASWAVGAVLYGLLFAVLFHGASLFEVRPEISAWFPAVGLRLALLLLIGWRFAFTAFVAEFAFGLIGGTDASELTHVAGVVSAGGLLGAVITAAVSPIIYGAAACLIIQAGWLSPRGAPLYRIFRLLGVVASASALAGLFGSLHLLVAGSLAWDDLAPAIVAWWLGDQVGILTVTPVALMLGHYVLKGRWPQTALSDIEASGLVRLRDRRRRFVLECIVVFGFAIAVFVIANHYGSPLRWYAFFMPTLWLALRLGLTGAAIGTLVGPTGVAAGASLWGAVGSPVDMQMFMILLSVTGLLIGALVSTLQEERSRLDRRVHARTRELRNEIELRRAAEMEAVQERHRAETYLGLARTPIVALDRCGCVMLINDEGCALLGYGRSDLVGKPWLDVAIAKEERHKLSGVLPGFGTDHPNDPGRFESEVITRTDQRRLIDWRATALGDEAGVPGGILLAGIDVTERAADERRIRHLASHDQLTGLLNRSQLFDRVDGARARARRYGTRLAVLFVDLDGFKAINDVFGHEVGDMVLKEVARRLTRAVRETDTVVRYGGDEFVVLLEDIHAPVTALQIATALLEALDDPLRADGNILRVGASIGTALFPDHGATAEALVRNADAAMYGAKRAGGGVRIVAGLEAAPALALSREAG